MIYDSQVQRQAAQRSAAHVYCLPVCTIMLQTGNARTSGMLVAVGAMHH